MKNSIAEFIDKASDKTVQRGLPISLIVFIISIVLVSFLSLFFIAPAIISFAFLVGFAAERHMRRGDEEINKYN